MQQQKKQINIFWFRRDLRLHDNCGLYNILKIKQNVQPIFIFDTNILDDLENKKDRRVAFIYEQVEQIKQKLIEVQSDLWVFYGKPIDVFQELTQGFQVKSVYTNHDYEPYAIKRDNEISRFCSEKGIEFETFKDQVIFEKNDVVKADGSPYTVFTPYMRKWKSKFAASACKCFSINLLCQNFSQASNIQHLQSIESLGFQNTKHLVVSSEIPINKIKNYHKTRDFLGDSGTSRLSVHLRFGTISIRNLIKIAVDNNETFLNELIWREFYMQILWHFPHVITKSFKPVYDTINWENNGDFEKWCQAKTGYPIVDAGIKELLSTGFMHNRARMIVASFLTKHLLVDWRKGEAFFAKHLTDYELSSNNGGWQWAASSGCDAVPYFRIFNPYMQTEKFDKDKLYIKKWNAEQGLYPIIEHKKARERCLDTYKKALEK